MPAVKTWRHSIWKVLTAPKPGSEFQAGPSANLNCAAGSFAALAWQAKEDHQKEEEEQQEQFAKAIVLLN